MLTWCAYEWSWRSGTGPSLGAEAGRVNWNTCLGSLTSVPSCLVDRKHRSRTRVVVGHKQQTLAGTVSDETADGTVASRRRPIGALEIRARLSDGTLGSLVRVREEPARCGLVNRVQMQIRVLCVAVMTGRVGDPRGRGAGRVDLHAVRDALELALVCINRVRHNGAVVSSCEESVACHLGWL
ncbi:hypothetical protein L1887_43441 [Cichorium endivia]|nr:hypothetical protein L1887_43441 [Cichorium endivia]